MLRRSIRLTRVLRTTHGSLAARSSSNYTKFFDKDDEAMGLTTLDRLLRIKPAISVEVEDADYDGIPTPEDLTDLDGAADPRTRLAKKLLSMSRVYYRHAEDLPAWFVERQNEICSNRTPAQIRRCLKDWMIKYDREEANKYSRHPLIWGEKLKQDHEKHSAMAFGPEETVAYTNYHMPSRFSITSRVFKELKTISPDFKPRRIVDFGCGPGTAAAAAFNIWGAEGTAKYTGIDMSTSMIDAAKIMTRGTISDCVFWDRSGEVIKRADSRNERFDLALCTYSLSDFANDPTRRAAVQILFELLDVGGYLVIVEQGNPKGSNMTRTARQLLLDMFNNVDASGRAQKLPTSSYLSEASSKKAEDDEEEDDEDEEDAVSMKGANKKGSKKNIKRQPESKQSVLEKLGFANLILPAPAGYSHDELGAFVVAPCTHDKPCPLGANTWCSFSQKVYSGMIRKSSEEKFSYLIIQKRPKQLVAGGEVPGRPVVKPFRSASGKGSHKLNREAEAIHREIAETPRRDPESFGLWTIDHSTASKPDGAAATSADSSASGSQKQAHPTPLNVLKRFMDIEGEEVQGVVDKLVDEVDWDEYRPPLHRQDYGRLVRSPIKNKGHVLMDLCMPSGALHRTTLSRANLISVPALYTAVRKTTWGGLFPVLADNDEQSAIAIRAKGNKGPVGEPTSDEEGRARRKAAAKKEMMRSPFAKDPVDPELAAEERELQRIMREQNLFTGRPPSAKTYYPPVPPPANKVKKTVAAQFVEPAEAPERRAGRRRGGSVITDSIAKAAETRRSRRKSSDNYGDDEA